MSIRNNHNSDSNLFDPHPMDEIREPNPDVEDRNDRGCLRTPESIFNESWGSGFPSAAPILPPRKKMRSKRGSKSNGA